MATLFLTRAIDRLVDVAHPGPHDAELLRRYLDTGDPKAFEHIVRRHARTVLGICRRILIDPHAADDAFQATFLQLVRKARTLHAPGALAAWLYATARRTALRHRRPGPPPQPAEPPASAQDPLDLLTARELLAAIEGEIARLPERYQLPLILCYLDGLSKQEAADRLGLPAGVFRGRLDRGRERLRSALARRGFAPAAALLGLLVPHPASASAELVGRTVGICARGESAPAAVALLAAGRVGVWTRAGVVAGLLLAVGLGVIAAAGPAGPPAPQAKLDPSPPAASAPRRDLHGDPLPPDAIARMGSVRWRHVHGFPSRRQVAPSPTGRLVAIVSRGEREEKRTVRVWDLADGRPVCEFPREDTLSGGDLRFTPDGSQLMFVGSRGVVRFHDPRTGKVLAQSKPVVEKDDLQPGGLSSGPYSKTQHRLTADGRWLVTSDDPKLTLSEVTTDLAATPHRVVLERPPGKHSFVSNCFSCDGTTLVYAGGGRGSVILRWDVRTGKLGRQTALNSRNNMVTAFSPDGRRVATWRYDVPPQDVLRVWDTETGAEVVELEGAQRSGYGGIAFSPDGTRLVAAKWVTEKAATAVVWELDRGKVVGRAPLPGWCTHFALLPDGKTLLAYSQMGMLFGTWDVATGRRLSPVAGHESGVRHLAFTPDGTTLLTAATDPQEPVTAWDAATGKKRQELAASYGPSHYWQGPSVPFVLTPGGAVVTTAKGTLVWTDRKTGRALRRVTLEPIAKAMTPRECFHAEWLSLTHDPNTGRPAVLGLHTFGPHPEGAGEPTDRWQGAVTLSDAESGELLAHWIFSRHPGAQGAVVSPDGRWLARTGYEPEQGGDGGRFYVEVNAGLG